MYPLDYTKIHNIKKDGTRFISFASVIRFNHAEFGDVFISVQSDITERRNLEKAMIETEDRERRRIGSDLHDGLGQVLTGISLKIQHLASILKKESNPAAKDTERIRYLLDKAREQTMLLTKELFIVDDDREAVSATFQGLASSTRELFNIPCTFKYDETDVIHNYKTIPNLLRIAQEAVHNAVKHGRAGHIEINLSKNNDEVQLSVSDDGIGIMDTAARTSGNGLKIMNYRTGLIGAHLDIISDRNKGTQVKCSFSDQKNRGNQHHDI